MQLTKIGWTDFSSNPIRARNIETGKAGHFCEKVSPGCAHCFASEWNENRYGTGMAFLPANRSKVEFWLNERELAEWQKPKYAGKRVFVCDMTDLFGEWVPDEWLDRIFAAMALSPATFLVLTKRPERMREYLGQAHEGVTSEAFEITCSVVARNPKSDIGVGVQLGPLTDQGDYGIQLWPLRNVWLGVSVENQRWADERIPILLDTPAAVRFLSCEPLLGPLDLTYLDWTNDYLRRWDALREAQADDGRKATIDAIVAGIQRDRAVAHPVLDCLTGYRTDGEDEVNQLNDPHLDWCIVGGESGRRARPMRIEWAQSIVDQCKAAGVACYVKQDSARYPGQQGRLPDELWAVKQWPEVRA